MIRQMSSVVEENNLLWECRDGGIYGVMIDFVGN